jgi:2-keto-4-pentenoate hydratase
MTIAHETTETSNAEDAAQIDPVADDRLRQAAELLLAARRERAPIADLPEGLRPTTLAEAYRLQDILISALGPVGGWKVGAPSPDAVPLCSPMPLLGGFAGNGGTIGATFSRFRGVEAEIAFLLGEDLPVRERPYSREEVVAAIAGAYPAIEILEPAYDDPDQVDRLSIIGDLQSNGGFAHGDAFAGWRDVELSHEMATMIVDGAVRVEATGSNPGGTDLLRLVTWLANEGQSRTGGLNAGHWITTGSWTGKVLANAGSEVIARFSSLGEVRIYFEL